MDRDVAWDVEVERIWKENESRGLPNPRCFVDVGEDCYMESFTYRSLQHPKDRDIPENCRGCRGDKWLRGLRGRAVL